MTPVNILMISLILVTTYSELALAQRPLGGERKEVTACEGSALNIICDRDEIIDVLSANYGRLSRTVCIDEGRWPGRDVNCKSPKSLNVVETECANQQKCTIQVNDRVFGGDPCPRTHKYLEVAYRCAPRRRDPRPSTEQAVACEGTTLSIKCERGFEISISKANYGRLSRTVCNLDGKASIRDVTCSTRNSEKIVEDYCQGKRNCEIPATNRVFGEPCNGTFKYLTVDYTCTRDRDRRGGHN